MKKLSETRPRALIFGMKHHLVNLYQIQIISVGPKIAAPGSGFYIHSVATSEFPKWQTSFHLQKISTFKIGIISKREMQII